MAVAALVSDFDGTITNRDFYLLIAERYMPSDAPDFFGQYRQGRISHIDAMQGFFRYAPSDAASLDTLIRDTDPDHQLAESFGRLAGAGWDVIIVSAGSSWYIDRILSKLNLHAEVHSNPGRIEPGRGLQLIPARESPFYSEDVGVDKSAVVRDAMQRYARVAFAGDGPPDVAPSLLVPPGLRFAKGYLADELQRRGEGYQPFERWSEIAKTLTGDQSE